MIGHPAAAQHSPSTTAQPTAQQPPAEEEKDISAYTLPPDKYQQARNFSRAWYKLYFFRAFYGFGVLLLVIVWKLGPRFRSLAERITGKAWLQGLAFIPLIALTLAMFNLPTRAYGHWLVAKYGISVQGWGPWLWDWTKGTLITMVILTVAASVVFAFLRRNPRRWWVYSWLLSVPAIVFLVFVYPLLIDPLFYNFRSLADSHPQLVDQIERVVQRGGLDIPRSRMFEMNASTKRTDVNAYVTGIGASKRVVFWDTTIRKMAPEQGLFVFGHEMGHYVLRHIPRGIALSALAAGVLLYLTHRGVSTLVARRGSRWGIRGLSDWAALPVLLLVFSVLEFLGTPISSAYSRWQEHQADVYGLEVIHGVVPDSPVVAARAFQALGELSLDDPDPPAFIEFWLYSHPPTDDRLRFARNYDPWAKGEPPKYVK